MPWNIYGQPLTPGTCEVHIGIPKPYPCAYCVEEMEQEQQRHDYYDQASDPGPPSDPDVLPF